MRAALLLACALLGAASAAPYRVQPGDTWWSLARRSGVSVAALQAMNGGGGLLRAGATVQLPASGGGAVAAIPARPATVRAMSAPAPSVFQRGQAVYYGGRRDSRTVMTAAHLTLPFGTWVRVTHARTGRSVDVLINDRGPFGNGARIIDLSNEAAAALGILSEGVAPVTLTVLSRP
ncbi:RlpA-like double-psi beta-barrel domain-containing protein [Deinococcus aquaedulcis]|uniref:RlpA-like double-psi beta-barrel domain-containing protein n=1 Tax=Deinococcus aquaedulcis TaxID=2840455 RepID=UPI001C832FC9|nr:RlpA-like double-psi beta-barrel domain-containing protein [Deinococcus aquaedulcis]